MLAVAALSANAQDGQYPSAAVDPPSRVARLNWFNGNVSFQAATVDEWSPAALNYPLSTGDHIYTDAGSRAEMRTGPNAIRLNWQTNFGFLNLDDRTVQMRVTEGALEIRLRRLDDDDTWEIDTPQGAITLLRTGDYRIETDPARNATMLTVRSGDAQVTGNGVAFTVHPRQTAYFQEGYQADIRDANPADDFDYFVADRNRSDDRIPPPVHVSDTMIGYEDLDANGSWRESPDYGWVWRPRTEIGWVPYHYGHWAWVEPWGWTWIDNASWGFAPFHYGRWVVMQGDWVWVPGAVVRRPVYAPALVVFAGGGVGVGGGFGGGFGVAWFPLGPREPYYPGYHVSPAYVRQVNITHVTNINVVNVTNVTNIRYVNQTVPGAVTAVDRATFVGARQVHMAAQTVRPGQYNTVVGSAPPVVPSRESVVGQITNRSVAAPSRTAMERAVVVRSTPPPQAIRFEARQQALGQNPGRPLESAQLNDLRARQPNATIQRAPVRVMPATGAPARPTFGAGQAAPAGERPIDRMNGRPPPNARPEAAVEPMQRPAPAVRPFPESRPVPEARPAMVEPAQPRREPLTRPIPEARPVPEVRPAPRPEPRAVEPRPAPEQGTGTRPRPQHETKKEKEKEEKKN